MKKEFTACDSELHVSFEDTRELRDDVFNKLMEYFKSNECFTGETLQQSDDCIIEAPEMLSDIVDNLIKFKTKWVE